MGEQIQKEFNTLSITTTTKNISHESQYSLIKMWSALKRKINKPQKKISSDDINDLREQNSDNESDKTPYEKKCPSNISRKANSVISNNSSRSDASTNTHSINSSSNSNDKTKRYTSKSIYRKREKSIDYVRNNHDDTTDYDVVLTYQKYIPKRTLSSGTLFDANNILRNK
tara:strand:+ start:535 stop:1047 length:513 start_codon:yes stop_codon:yes gene_type:complete